MEQQKSVVHLMEHEPLSPLRPRALSHRDYLSTLPNPSTDDICRIAEIQQQKENEIDRKYHTNEERNAAITIQAAYRGHRERRQMAGLTLDPSSRWTELIKELQFRTAIAPHAGTYVPGPDGREYTSAELARINWSRVAQIAERASSPGYGSPKRDTGDVHSPSSTTPAETHENSMMMDLRYFLEMIDQKHRYGANLQIYWEEWQSSGSSQNFFYWLDGRHGEGRNFSHPYCDREKLERECIRYLTREERQDYLVTVDSEGRLRWVKNNELITTSVDDFKDSMHGIVPVNSNEPCFQDESVKESLSESLRFNRKLAALRDSALDKINDKFHYHFKAEKPDSHNDDTSSIYSFSSSSSSSHIPFPDSALAHQAVTADHTPNTSDPTTKTKRKHHRVSPATILNSLLRKSVRPGTWIYVADTLGRLYIGIKSSGAFQHASFLAGGRISSAGSIGVENGKLTYLSPLSGHYRPTTKSFKAFVDKGLKGRGVDMSGLRISKAYAVLLGMEYYSGVKEGWTRMLSGKKGGKGGEKDGREEQGEEDFVSATGLVEEHWEKEAHAGGLRRLVGELNIGRKSGESERG